MNINWLTCVLFRWWQAVLEGLCLVLSVLVPTLLRLPLRLLLHDPSLNPTLPAVKQSQSLHLLCSSCCLLCRYYIRLVLLFQFSAAYLSRFHGILIHTAFASIWHLWNRCRYQQIFASTCCILVIVYMTFVMEVLWMRLWAACTGFV